MAFFTKKFLKVKNTFYFDSIKNSKQNTKLTKFINLKVQYFYVLRTVIRTIKKFSIKKISLIF